jgi:DNA-binding CsgD family transcriptional regulator
MSKVNIRNPGLRFMLGIIGALLQGGLAILDHLDSEPDIFIPFYLGIALLFLASSVIACLVPIQAGLFFILSGLVTVSTLNSLFGLCFALAASLVLFRIGAFLRWPWIKAAILVPIGSLVLIYPIVTSDMPPLSYAEAAIAAVIYSTVIIALARGRVLSAFGPKKPVLRLSDYDLTDTEELVIVGRLKGKDVKQIAYEANLSASTVRNALAKACRKLHLPDRESIGAMAERYRIVP